MSNYSSVYGNSMPPEQPPQAVRRAIRKHFPIQVRPKECVR